MIYLSIILAKIKITPLLRASLANCSFSDLDKPLGFPDPPVGSKTGSPKKERMNGYCHYNDG
jgi:hypothetical protein